MGKFCFGFEARKNEPRTDSQHGGAGCQLHAMAAPQQVQVQFIDFTPRTCGEANKELFLSVVHFRVGLRIMIRR